MSEEFEERFIKPIINASYPGTLAGLGLTALSITGQRSIYLTASLASGAFLFLLSAPSFSSILFILLGGSIGLGLHFPSCSAWSPRSPQLSY